MMNTFINNAQLVAEINIPLLGNKKLYNKDDNKPIFPLIASSLIKILNNFFNKIISLSTGVSDETY